MRPNLTNTRRTTHSDQPPDHVVGCQVGSNGTAGLQSKKTGAASPDSRTVERALADPWMQRKLRAWAEIPGSKASMMLRRSFSRPLSAPVDPRKPGSPGSCKVQGPDAAVPVQPHDSGASFSLRSLGPCGQTIQGQLAASRFAAT
jgi:hypothetical protein